MDNPHFRSEILRLSEQFGVNQYSEARCLVIWSEVKGWPNSWLTRAVDFFLGEFRTAPLIQDFRTFGSQLRDQFYAKQKEALKHDSKQFWKLTEHSDDEIRWRVDTIKRRLAGTIGEEEWQNFKKQMKEFADLEEKMEKEAMRKKYGQR